MFPRIDTKHRCQPGLFPLALGDVVLIRIPNMLFLQVADASGSWTNHVGVVVDHDGTDWVVAESCVPFVRRRRFSDFVARSERGEYVVRRLPAPLGPDQQSRLKAAADARMGRLYHTGFALRSRRQFCSKFVHEVLEEACGEQVGSVETFRELLARRPDTSLLFWRLWYFGRIPWQRETITPDSLLRSARLRTVFATASCAAA